MAVSFTRQDVTAVECDADDGSVGKTRGWVPPHYLLGYAICRLKSNGGKEFTIADGEYRRGYLLHSGTFLLSRVSEGGAEEMK